jgi:cellulose synthase operon protein C
MQGCGLVQRRAICAVGALMIAAGMCAPAGAQTDPHPLREGENKDVKTPDVAEPVLRRVEATYLTPDERKDLRVFHGIWVDGDLDTPVRRAKAALTRGSYDDLALTDASVPPEDRAEAMLLRGDGEQALMLLENATTNRAARLRAQALESLGRFDDAAAAIDSLVEQLRSQKLSSPEELVEGVRALILRTRLRPQQEPAGGDFQRILQLLATARDDLGRLYWPAYLTEAELLYEKDSVKDGAQAATQALSMNPSSAQAWLLMGRIAVESFNFEGAEQVVDRLRELGGEASPEAAQVAARAALRQNDPDGALEAIAPALQKYPKMRALLALNAAAHALKYDFEKANTLLAEFDRLSPGSPLAQFETGRALSEARQYEHAEKYLALAAERAPYWAEPVTELGLMSLQAGKVLNAGDALRKSVKLDPFNIRAGNTLKLVDELAKYEKIESDHFVVRYAPGIDEVLARDMLGPLEKLYRRVTGDDPGGIDFEPPFKTTIDLMPDKRWFGVRIAGVTRIHTMAASTGPAIAMEAPREGPRQSVGTYDWLRVVQHEFTHTVTLARTNNRIPHWFTEAAAVYLEDSPRAYNTIRLLQGAVESDSLFDLREINLAFVRPKKPTDRAQAYAQGHWMYEYIITRWGQGAPLDLMDRYAAGDREEAAFTRVLGVDTATFLAQFKGWARQQLAEWGMAPRPGEPSLAEILEQVKIGVGEDAQLDDAMVDLWLLKHPAHPGLLEAKVRFALRAAGNQVDEEIVPLLEKYAGARPVDPQPHQLLAQYYLAQESGPERAIPHLEYLDAREQNSVAYAAELARLYAATGDLEKAGAKAERVAIIGPYVAGNRELAATAALQRKDYPAAVRHIEALTRLEPGREIHKKRLEAVQKLAGAGNQPPQPVR